MRPKCYQTWNESQTEMLVSMKHSTSVTVTVKVATGLRVEMDQIIGTYQHDNIERTIKAATAGIISWVSEGEQVTIPESNRFERLCIISVNGIQQTEKKQIQVTLRELNSHAKGVDKWRISLNENLYVNEIIGFHNDHELVVKVRGAVEYLAVPGDYKFDDVVLILSSLPDCRHLRVEEGRCVYCKEQIQAKQEEHCFPGWHMDESMARRYSLEVIRYTILNKRKLILVLDLDQTILHAIKIMKEFDSLAYINQTNAELPAIDHNSFTTLGYTIPEALLEMKIDKNYKFIIKLRPYFKQFFMKTIPIYEFYIYTKASRGYAEFILGFLTQNLKEHLPDHFPFFPNNRIFSREDTSVQNAKSLNRLFFPGVADHLMIILDDNASMWTEFKDNLIHTRPYTYFKEGTNKDSQGIAIDVEDKIIINNRYDFWLLAITEQLVKISQVFWDSLNDARQNYYEPFHIDPEFPLKRIKVEPAPDDLTILCNRNISVKTIYAKLRAEILKDVKLFFSISQSHTSKQIAELETAKALSIKLGAKLSNLENCDMLITIGRKKVRSIADAIQQKIPIVAVQWIFDCDVYMRNLPIDYYASEQDLSEESRDKVLKQMMFKKNI